MGTFEPETFTRWGSEELNCRPKADTDTDTGERERYTDRQTDRQRETETERKPVPKHSAVLLDRASSFR